MSDALGAVLGKIAEDLNAKGDLLTLLAGLAGPGGFTADAALAVLGKATNIVADVLQLDQDKRVGAYVGLFSPTEPWPPRKLRQEAHGASIRLAEVNN